MNVYQVELAISLKGRWAILLMEVNATTENEAMDFAVDQAEDAGVSVEEMCSIIDSNPKGPAAMFVRKLVGLA